VCGAVEGETVLTEDGGVLKRVLCNAPEDATQPPWGALVRVTYTCAFSNGTVFDRAHEDSPFEFQLNGGNVVDGLQRGVESMQVGERARFTCAPRWAHGSAGAGSTVPADSTLQYEVELLSWQEGPPVEDDNLDMETYKASLEGNAVASGSSALYSWSEGGEEMTLLVPLNEGQGARDIKCEFQPRHLRVAVASGGASFEGELRGRVTTEDCYWVLDDDGDVKILQIVLAKRNLFTRWDGPFLDAT